MEVFKKKKKDPAVSRKIGSGIGTRFRRRIDIVDDNCLSCDTGNPHINIVCTKPTGILKEVVFGARS